MWQVPDMTLWCGRIDEGENARRWHQDMVAFNPDSSQTSGVVLLGIASDEGVKRNQGRTGAQMGSVALKKILASLPRQQPVPLYDAGSIVCEGSDLESMQTLQAETLKLILNAGHTPVVLGGGHEIAAGSFTALADTRATDKRLGIINFDAHFDIRPDACSSSGTPFRQAAERCQQDGKPFCYLCLGIAETSNTAALFNDASMLGIKWLRDDELSPWLLEQAKCKVKQFLADVDELHLSIDLDVLPASVAPGVSAPAARGIDIAVMEELLEQIRRSGKIRLIDIAEYNPEFDIDGRTARVAARLVHRLTKA